MYEPWDDDGGREAMAARSDDTFALPTTARVHISGGVECPRCDGEGYLSWLNWQKMTVVQICPECEGERYVEPPSREPSAS